MPVLKIPQPIFGYGEILRVLRALKEGDFAVRMSTNLEGLDGEIAAVFNDTRKGKLNSPGSSGIGDCTPASRD